MIAVIKKSVFNKCFCHVHVTLCQKRKRSHFHFFLIGSEDVGKTTITNCLLKALVRYFDSKPGGNTNELKRPN